MTDTLSVLLLIGSAVVGPVETQSLPSYCPEGATMQPHPKWQAANEAERKTLKGLPSISRLDEHRQFCVLPDKAIISPIFPVESLDQLCERAMREIGAINSGRWHMPPQTRDEQLAPLFVRCIPTPKGYRK